MYEGVVKLPEFLKPHFHLYAGNKSYPHAECVKLIIHMQFTSEICAIGLKSTKIQLKHFLLLVSTITEEPQGTGTQSRMLTVFNKISQTYMASCLLPF